MRKSVLSVVALLVVSGGSTTDWRHHEVYSLSVIVSGNDGEGAPADARISRRMQGTPGHLRSSE